MRKAPEKEIRGEREGELPVYIDLIETILTFILLQVIPFPIEKKMKLLYIFEMPSFKLP